MVLTRIGVVCGLASEARVVRRACADPALSDRLDISISGANGERAYRLAKEFADRGAQLILSIGISGGLSPALGPGDLVLAEGVVDGDGHYYACDREQLSGLHKSVASLPAPSLIYGSDRVILTADEKSRLHATYRADSVDMESHGVARAAHAAGIGFMAVRAIADPSDRILPPAALDAVKPDGTTKLFSPLLNAAKAPGQFPALLQLGRDSEKALAALRDKLGPVLGFLLG